MPKNENLIRIFQYALNQEETGKIFYENALKKLEISSAKNAFIRLIKEEEKHVEVIKRILKGLKYGPDLGLSDIEKIALKKKNFFDKKAKSNFLKQIKGGSSVIDVAIFNAAWLIEKEHSVFYMKMAEQTGGNGSHGEASLNELKFIIDRRGLVLRFSERFFFDSGDASIRPEVVPLLTVLAQSLESLPNQIRIEGHTDSVPIRTPRFPSNWELSTTRATSIVHYFLTHHRFEPGRLSAAGYGEFRPIAKNQTADGRSQNRRVDIVILSTKEGENEPVGEEKA